MLRRLIIAVPYLWLIALFLVPFAIVPFGWPQERKPPADRYDEARVHHDRW